MVSKGAGSFVLWPRYFDARLTRAEGRRVPETVAVKGPDAKWIETAAHRLELVAQLQADARHPSIPYEKVGRVLVTKSGASKQAVLNQVAAQMHEMQSSRA